MTALTPWSYGGVEVRTITEGADVYFVASDVAAILGYGHTPHMTRSLDEDEKGVRRTDTLGGEQLLTVITEAGLYRAIIQRQAGRVADDNTKASVKAFQRWVTHEVLPSIRRSGSYSVAPAYALPQSYAEALRALAETVEAKDRAVAEAHALSPRAAAWDHMASTAGDYSVQQAAGILGRDPSITTGRQRLFQWLATAGWIFRDRSTGHWMAYASRIDSGLATHRAQHHIHPRTGEVVLDPPQVRITIKGLNALHAALGGSAPLDLDHAPTALEPVAQ